MVLRTLKSGNFTTIDNCIFKDRTLSFKAKGLICVMLSLPQGWDFNVDGLATLSSDGTTAVKSALKELEAGGYLKRKTIREKGKIVDTEYTIAENPVLFSDPDVIIIPCDSPAVDEPLAENPPAENMPLLNTNKSKTYESNTYSNAKGGFGAIINDLPVEVRESVLGFVEMRKKIRAPITERGLRLAVKKAMKLSGGDVEKFNAIFDQSTEKSWRGVFPVDSQQSSGNPYIDMLKEGIYD